MGSDPDLQASLQQYLGGEIHPKRVLLMTNEPLFHLLGTSTKISVEGTFTIAPSDWKQVFILQVCEEGKTVNFAFVHYELSKVSSNWRQSKYKVTFLT